ncbi:ABC transporter ATP-binding protein, partial [Bacillus cereus]|nr:ABC transporter ATP-binding protein [Bacillus cereus]
ELEAAGIEIPATLRLAALVADKTGAPLDDLPADPAGWADWIAERLGMKAAGRGDRPLDSREGD